MNFKKLFIALVLISTFVSTAEAVAIIIDFGGNQRGCRDNYYCPAPPPMVYQGTRYYYDSCTSRYSNGYVVQDVTDHYIDGTCPGSGRVYREVNSQVWWNGHYINR